MPSLGSRIFTLDIIGFSTADRTLIASMFALSRRRTFQYEEYAETGMSLVPRKRPDLFLVDVDNLKSMSVLQSKSPDATHPAVLIGHASHSLEWKLVKRPIKWLDLFEALDKSVEQANAAQALVPAENRRGWPFFDRRKRSRIAPASEIKAVSEAVTPIQPAPALGSTSSAPTLSLLNPDHINMGDGPGNSPLVRDPSADTVLVVDDDRTARRFLADQLVRFNVNIDFAVNGEQALGMIARKRYVCIWLKTSLPGIDGYQTCHLIKTGTIPSPSVVMVSAKSNPLDRVRARLAGCDAFWDKQADFDTLAMKLAPYAAAKSKARPRPAAS
jgi:two-component system cell cycle response regulator